MAREVISSPSGAGVTNICPQRTGGVKVAEVMENQLNRIRHEFLLGPDGKYNTWYGIFFITKVVVPVWCTTKDKDGTVRRAPTWQPTLIRGHRPSEVIANLEKVIQGFVKSGAYRRIG